MTTAEKVEPTVARVVVGRLQQVRRGARIAPAGKAKRAPGDPGPARVALLLALAHSIRRAIEAGELKDQAEAAHRFGVTRARVTQLLDLALLAPTVQEAVLRARMVDGAEPLSERTLRCICRYESWSEQREAWNAPRKERM